MNRPFPFAVYPAELQKALKNTQDNFDKRLMRNALALRTNAMNISKTDPRKAHRLWSTFMQHLNDMTPEQHQQISDHVGGIDDLYPMEYTHLAPVSLLPDVGDEPPKRFI